MTIYYRIIDVWCKYPFQDTIDYRYCEFSYSKKRFKGIENLKIDSQTSIKEKEDYLKKELNLKNVIVKKI